MTGQPELGLRDWSTGRDPVMARGQTDLEVIRGNYEDGGVDVIKIFLMCLQSTLYGKGRGIS